MRRAVLCLVGCLALGASLWAQETSLTDLHDKTVLLFTPHPDDDVFGAGGTIALLNRNHNRVYIVIYTNDDKGSYDPEIELAAPGSHPQAGGGSLRGHAGHSQGEHLVDGI